ncbi:hypothetical protein [Pelagovum pacificum]|uniref:DUF423 domain-containing protein n=1 Tax=Pelagovum pacificum TaxID=2588711 RepID=A0A5C5GAA4_9RHOB|nr:hypothetical protein [Pelagovum pacificum]QQA41623.1 hypothetical protein I8N54_12430 [Pelagovum pacificum]TNY30902.1 hypothetical protein FHY64_17505 [Pelagovum pacificum]
MRNAALVLGLIAGLIGIVVGMIGYGYAEVTARSAEFAEVFGLLDRPDFIRFASFFAPLFAIAGGAMAKARALWGGVLLIASAALFYGAFGFNVGTMFPIGFAALAGLLAIAAGKPDEPKAHF